MSLLVERSGALATLQDGGRFGVRHLGATQGGALDWIAQGWANWLLGNSPSAATVEITLGNFVVLAEADVWLALCGADLGASLDGESLLPGRGFLLRAGQRLTFRQPVRGARAYLAAPGGFAAPRVLGSCASVRREGLGGLHGDGVPLQAGNRLHPNGSATLAAERCLPDQYRLQKTATTVLLPVVLGAQSAEFSGRSLFDAFNSEWQVDARADRMGVRLLGPKLQGADRSMISEGIPLGAIQVPPDGQPIVLLNDRQTIGGYPRLGALTPEAVARLAQCLPGEQVRMVPIGLEAAQRRHHELLELWH